MASGRSDWVSAPYEAETLQLPGMYSEPSARPRDSPTFENFPPQSNIVSPLPMQGGQFQSSTPSQPLWRPSDQYSSTNSYSKFNETSYPHSLTNSPHTVPPVDPYLSTNAQPMRSSQNGRMSDQMSPAALNANRSDPKLTEWSLSNSSQMKMFDAPSMSRTNSKPNEPWLANNSLNRTTNSTSSDIRMIESSSKKSGTAKNCCSTRCKLGLLGFTIGVLAVGIAVAVVLVLWLRR